MPRPHITYTTTNPGAFKVASLGRVGILLRTLTDCTGPDELSVVLTGGRSRSGGLEENLAALTVTGRWTAAGSEFSWRLPRRNWKSPPPAGPTLDDLETLSYRIRGLVTGSMHHRIGFSFLLEDPAKGTLLPYHDDDFAPGAPEMYSRLFFDAPDDRVELHLVFPADRMTDEIVIVHDALAQMVDTPLSRNKFKVRTAAPGGRVRQKPVAFERAQHRLTPAAQAHHPALFEAVCADPDDDAPRLVYGDWLLEQGDPRGELIAVQCELTRLLGKEPASTRVYDLRRREAQLVFAHRARWLEIPPLRSPVLRRGFIDTITLYDCDELDRNAAAIFAAAPLLSSLELVVGRDADLRVLVTSPHFARIRRLTLRSVEAVESLTRCREHIGHLRDLCIAWTRPSIDVVQALLAATNLRSLDLAWCHIDEEGQRALQRSEHRRGTALIFDPVDESSNPWHR
jgi:uncharacterized protein (TIGR02996 family)